MLKPAEAHSEADRRHHLRDRLRPVRLAAYRHVRRGRAHDHGAPCLPRAHRGQDPDAADLLLRRHGRLAQGAGQRPKSRDAGRASWAPADPSARPVRRPSELRPAQQCAAQAFLDTFGFDYEFLSATECYISGPLRRDAAQGAGELRRDPRRDPADARPRTPRDLQPLAADLADHGPRAASADRRPRRCRGLDPLQGPRYRQAHASPRHARPLQAAMEGGLGHALGGAWRRLRDGGQGPDQLGATVRTDLPHSRRAAAGRLHLRAVPRRERREDLEVARQRAHHRGMADLRGAREPVALYVPKPAQGEAALFRRDPARGRRICRPSRGLPEGGDCGAADERGLAHPSGHPSARRASDLLCAAARILPARRTRRTATCCGASSGAMRRTQRPRRIRCSTSSWATPSATSTTS